MPKFFLFLICAVCVSQLAIAQSTSPKPQSPVTEWRGPDVSLDLKSDGKQSESARQVNEHKSAAQSLYNQNRFEEAGREYQTCLELDPTDFQASLGVGYCLYNRGRYDEALAALEKARLLWPESYDANFWIGTSLARLGRFKEAIPYLEEAHAARKDDKAARRGLFFCYLVASHPKKAFQLYPTLITKIGGALVVIYFLGLAALLPFSFPVRNAVFPGLRFAISWVALFFEGQFAFLFLIAALPWLQLNEIVLTGVTLAGLPVIAVAATGFARQPWGGPFRWPLRFGPLKIFVIAVIAVLIIQMMSAAASSIYVRITNNPAPLQNTIPLIRNALSANAAVAWLTIAFVIPLIEEILFRGLVFGAFQKRWGLKGAMVGSSFLFACIHLQLLGFIYLFFFGLVLGWARWKSDSLGLPVLIHSLNNTAALILMAVTNPV